MTATKKRKTHDHGAPARRRPLETHERFLCPAHGFLVDALPDAVVHCSCGRMAKVEVRG